MLNVKKLLTKMLNELNTDKYISESKTSSSVSITPNGRGTVSIDVSKSGYTPIGIVGIFVPDTDVFVVNEFFLASATTVTVILTNLYSASRASAVRVNVLYRKLGGVLRSSIFKAFSDFVSLLKGGDVNVECKEITYADTNNHQGRQFIADFEHRGEISKTRTYGLRSDIWRVESVNNLGSTRHVASRIQTSKRLLLSTFNGNSKRNTDRVHRNEWCDNGKNGWRKPNLFSRGGNNIPDLTLGRGWAVC